VGIVLPITAIYSTQDGASYVIPASDPREHITVDLGENVDGWVAIKGDSALKEGEEVILGMQRGG
jgi:multidrug efflux pump subunit AcrA (membrane-fusion protein)